MAEENFSALVAAQKETSRLLQEQIRQNMTADERAEADRIAEEKRQKASEAATRGWQTRTENAAAKADTTEGAAATEKGKKDEGGKNKQNRFLKGILDFSKKSFKTAKDGIKSGLPSFKSLLIGGLAAAALVFLNSPKLKEFANLIKKHIIPGIAFVVDELIVPFAKLVGKGLKDFFSLLVDFSDNLMKGDFKKLGENPSQLIAAFGALAGVVGAIYMYFKGGKLAKLAKGIVGLGTKAVKGAGRVLGIGKKKGLASVAESAVGGKAPATAARGRPTGGGGGKIARVAQGIQKVGVAAGKGIGGFIGGILKGIASGLASIAAPPVLIGLAAVVLAINGIALAIRIMTPAFEPIGKMMKSFGASVREVFGGLGDFVKDIGKTIEGVIGSISDAIGKVVDKISKMSTAGTDATTKQITALSKIPGVALQETAAGLTAMKTALEGFGGGAISKILKGFGDVSKHVDHLMTLTKKVPELLKAAESISVIAAAGSDFAMADAELKRRKRVMELKKGIAGGTGAGGVGGMFTNEDNLKEAQAELTALEGQAMNMQVSGGTGVIDGLQKIEKLVLEIIKMKKEAAKKLGGATVVDASVKSVGSPQTTVTKPQTAIGNPSKVVGMVAGAGGY